MMRLHVFSSAPVNLYAVTGQNKRKHVQHFHSESVSAMAVPTTNGNTPLHRL